MYWKTKYDKNDKNFVAHIRSLRSFMFTVLHKNVNKQQCTNGPPVLLVKKTQKNKQTDKTTSKKIFFDKELPTYFNK